MDFIAGQMRDSPALMSKHNGVEVVLHCYCFVTENSSVSAAGRDDDDEI